MRFLGASAHACARECACDTLPVSQCVRQERCIALRRCVKASENTRSLGSLARLSLFLSASAVLFGGPPFSPVVPPRHAARVPFSPFQSLRRKVPSPPFLPRASLHFDCIVATAREKASSMKKSREPLSNESHEITRYALDCPTLFWQKENRREISFDFYFADAKLSSSSFIDVYNMVSKVAIILVLISSTFPEFFSFLHSCRIATILPERQHRFCRNRTKSGNLLAILVNSNTRAILRTRIRARNMSETSIVNNLTYPTKMEELIQRPRGADSRELRHEVRGFVTRRASARGWKFCVAVNGKTRDFYSRNGSRSYWTSRGRGEEKERKKIRIFQSAILSQFRGIFLHAKKS